MVEPIPIGAGDRHRVQARQVARRLLSHQRHRRQVDTWLHDSRQDVGMQVLRGASGGVTAEQAERWLSAAGLPMPALDAFLRGGQALYGLSVGNMVRLARLRALHAHAAELRHWIDTPRRALLASWLGPRAGEWVSGILAHASPASVESGGALSRCCADSLAWQGYCLLLRDGVVFDQGPCGLIPLALDAACAVGVPAVCDWADTRGSLLVAQLAVRHEEMLA
ncbi:HrpB4 protein [plant metagenome]|uniref:HrpB4 protein n=2 Tax=root TaxID=1 RepID=A0A1C3K2J1_9BURK|nr:type III secretion protein HrpB4 [Orrella dioscoreae]SBT25625.1 HrpB4 protein [Orrella dioscoreae]SOE47042.1 HrpB4 protein [Orrella dioscoreae]